MAKTQKPKRPLVNTKKAPTPGVVVFPNLSPKSNLECRVLLHDQILLIDGILDPTECKRLVKIVDSLPLELTPPKKRGEADRLNHRISITSVDIAQKLHTLLVPHLPSFPSSASKAPSTSTPRRSPHSFNSNIRLYKYTPSQHFGPHYDDAVHDPETGAKSEWTLLIYLSGVEDGVQGGETLFYHEQRGKPPSTITAPLTRGSALLHRLVLSILSSILLLM